MGDYVLFHHGKKLGSSHHPQCWKESKDYRLSLENERALSNNETFVFKTEDLLKANPVFCVVVGIMEYKNNPDLTRGAQSLIKYSVNKQIYCDLLEPLIFPAKY